MPEKEDYEEICTFCSEVRGTNELNLFFDLGISREEYILYETEHWAVIPCVGALTDWYVLIVSKRHTLSVGWLSEEERANLRQVIAIVQEELHERSGFETILFEHGSLDFRDKGGACFDHTHVHVVATMQNMDEFLTFVPKAVQLEDTNDWISRATSMVQGERLSYLALADRSCQMIGVAKGARSQFFRRCLASWLGVPDGEWDWFVNPQFDRVRRMTQGKWR